jgi:hypothetical protein
VELVEDGLEVRPGPRGEDGDAKLAQLGVSAPSPP